MGTLISFRLTKEDEKNLALLEATGLSRTQAIRAALASHASHLHSGSSISQEAESLSKNQDYVLEIEDIKGFFSGSDPVRS